MSSGLVAEVYWPGRSSMSVAKPGAESFAPTMSGTRQQKPDANMIISCVLVVLVKPWRHCPARQTTVAFGCEAIRDL